ncbi:MAG: hypothetical protein RL582_1664 [Bacteroidota bacterium]|jgi:glycosyltransferase involved in cell wall biosynthesis
MTKSKRILFLTLNSFSATGGIEKVCQTLSVVLNDFAITHHSKLEMFSMYDTPEQMKNNKYVASSLCKGFSGKKISFTSSAVQKGIKSDTIVLSHLNLLPIAWMIKLLSPSSKIILLAHGIEIWQIPPGIKRKMMYVVDKWVCVSRFTAQKAMDIFKISPQKIEVINNTLDPFLLPREKFHTIPNWRDKYSLGQNDFVLFTLSRLDSRERYKGYDHVIEAMGALVTRYPNVKYVIGGSSDAKELEFIKELIRKNKLDNNVVLTGFIKEEELPAHFLMSDVFIMPSNQEGFGISFIEAMYFGLPVIGGNADGSVDALANGELGTLIEPGNIKSIIDSIQNAIIQKGNNKPDFQKVNDRFGFETYKKKWSNLLLGLS